MTFEEYLVGKRIDGIAFHQAETNLWDTWKAEYEQMHPNSFTAQKLYLINPIRRKYPLKENPIHQSTPSAPTESQALRPKPVFKPKPKIS